METTTDRYQLISLLAENGPLQAWKATQGGSAGTCYLKIVRGNGEPETRLASEILLESVRLQQRVRSANIVRARLAITLGGCLHVEYPYLAEEDWTGLTPDRLWQSPSSLIAEICFTLDYLHLLGVVHGDVKLDNFMISSDGSKVRLIDLDFASSHGSRPHGVIFGSPDHIAPEIISNSIVLAQSDNFSLGFALNEACRWHAENLLQSDQKSDAVEAVRRFAAAINVVDYYQRPFGLLESARQHRVITEELYLVKQRQLLGNMLYTRIGRMRRDNTPTAERLEHELRVRIGVFGLHRDLLAAWLEVYGQAPRQAIRLAADFIANIELSRFERFFCVTCSDNQSRDFMRTADRISGRKPGLGTDSLSCAREHAQRVSDEGAPLRAYLFLRELDAVSRQGPQSTDRAGRKRLLARLATALDRIREANEYYQQILADEVAESAVKAVTVEEAAMAALRAGAYTTAKATTALAHSAKDLTAESRLQIQRIDAWLLNQTGRVGEAEDLFQQILTEAATLGLHRAANNARYGLAFIRWRRGDLREALDLLRFCVAEARAHGFLAQSPGVLSLLSSLYVSFGRYRLAFRCSAYALKVATPEQAPSLSSHYLNIIGACIRMAAFDRARMWLQEYQACRSMAGHPSYMRILAIYQGIIEKQAGNLLAGTAALASAIAPDPNQTQDAFVGKAYQNLALDWCWRGDIDKCRAAAGQARQIFERIGDRASQAEVDTYEFIVDVDLHKGGRGARWRELIKQLESSGSMYCAAQAVFFALEESALTVAEAVSDEMYHLLRLKSSGRVPLFAALRALVWRGDLTQLSPASQVIGWKRAFSRFDDGKALFFAARAAILVARFYNSAGRVKHADKYLIQAKRLAESLENSTLIATITEAQESIMASTAYQSHMLDSYVGISQLLRDLDNYTGSLNRILQFAINQTGAERGILFLKRADKRELVIGASENCDQVSLHDLTDFSSNLALLPADSPTPVIIPNALEDQRTNKYRSVLRYNILSVALIPLWDKDTYRGVLYLDHHTIPGLFEADDLRYLQSLANFLSLIIATSANMRHLALSNAQLRDQLGPIGISGSMVTQDPVLQDLLTGLTQVARTTSIVLLLGESGTGKEILADMIHRLSPRAGEPMVRVNCASLMTTMLESELFGVAKHVATGVAEREGKFAAADGGTLFLDEIGDMPLELQAKILRVIENHHYERVGSNKVMYADVRIICATNQDLHQLQAEKRFRSDLYFRISAFPIHIPPLRERLNDIPLLMSHFIEIYRHGAKPPRFSDSAMDALLSFSWPGNVRQLRNLVERSCIMYPGQTVEATHLPPEIIDPNGRIAASKEAKEALERIFIQRSLRENLGNQSKTARQLGMPLATLRRKITKYRL